jgi:uncharacterized protein (DUF1501 family)
MPNDYTKHSIDGKGRGGPMRPSLRSRREFLWDSGGGLGGVAMAYLLGEEGVLSDVPRMKQEGGLHHPARAKRVIQLFMNGGASPMDTFDFKPELVRRHDQQVDFGIDVSVTGEVGKVMKCPFEWKQHGQCGRWVSSVFPQVAKHVDEMAFLMAMASKTNVHGPASYMQNTGFLVGGYPAMGAWVSYALGSLSDDLPAYVVLPDPAGLPYNNRGNFSPGFLPKSHQGVVIQPNAPVPIANLAPPQNASSVTKASEEQGLKLLENLNRRHLQSHPGDARLASRLESYELAARMQLRAPEALELSRETDGTRDAYGLGNQKTETFGRNCLTARRLLERGVRFVQVWSGAGGASNNWDNHTDIPKELPAITETVDQPISALLQDLKQRGMLDDTLVVWTTEFGRMPFTQNDVGRDHNGGAFVSWMAGGGVKGGTSYGKSDDFAYQTMSGKTYCYDLHATILHLLGIDHERLTVRHNGIDRRLTDVHGNVVRSILA